jgi:hypothetical protein
MKYERLLQAQEDSLLLLLFQDSFTWEIMMASYSGTYCGIINYV